MLDSNIILSGLFFEGNERELLKLALRGRITLVLSDRIAQEIREVTERKFSADASKGKALELLNLIESCAETVRKEEYAHLVVEAKRAVRDETDAPILAAAIAAKPECLITGDADFLALKQTLPFKILKTRQFLERFGHGLLP